MKTTQRRIAQLEAKTQTPGGTCPHAAAVRLYDLADALPADEPAELCEQCGLPKRARINVIALPDGMTAR